MINIKIKNSYKPGKYFVVWLKYFHQFPQLLNNFKTASWWVRQATARNLFCEVFNTRFDTVRNINWTRCNQEILARRASTHFCLRVRQCSSNVKYCVKIILIRFGDWVSHYKWDEIVAIHIMVWIWLKGRNFFQRILRKFRQTDCSQFSLAFEKLPYRYIIVSTVHLAIPSKPYLDWVGLKLARESKVKFTFP